MTIDEIDEIVSRAIELRPPRPRENYPPSERVADIEDYLLESAFVHAELEEALVYLSKLVKHFKSVIDDMTGWEVALPNGKRGDRVTQADELRAKRKIDPASFDAGAHARELRDTVYRQTARFEYEAKVLSRVYTLITGGS